ncbi:two-component system, NarL family, response regulator DesR [Nonomuraea jiangxiensis]|uniref:Two-component system, NarL family, response regulator DesR n=1 Tax=Nonomuraea jiangxiensis TaxID=633440 RepID=A0A1G9GNA9_9ACTN|nr:two-component system, NarL family, response regulator DesR [Nonomuraea jiangxiensis]
MIRVMLAEDQGKIRGALASLLGLEPDIEVVGEAADGREAIAVAVRTRPDVALLDIEMPGMDGLAAGAEIVDQVPGCRVMILTTFGRPGYLRTAMEAGAVAFMVKDKSGQGARGGHPAGARGGAGHRPRPRGGGAERRAQSAVGARA